MDWLVLTCIGKTVYIKNGLGTLLSTYLCKSEVLFNGEPHLITCTAKVHFKKSLIRFLFIMDFRDFTVMKVRFGVDKNSATLYNI